MKDTILHIILGMDAVIILILFIDSLFAPDQED